MFEWRGDRVDYTGELLSPPEGWRFERAVATTYSLDLETLLTVLLPLAFGESPDAPEAHRDGLLLLRALRRVAPRLTVFHQTGQIPVPKRHSALMPLLDRILVPVALPKRGRSEWTSFHPKTWTLEYRDADGNARFRFVALSRNLTGDDSRDVAVALESGKDRRKTRGTAPLRDFLGFLGRQVPGELPHAREHVARATAMAKGLTLHPLELDEAGPWEDFAILPLTGGVPPDDPLFAEKEPGLRERPRRVVAMSPFLGDGVVERLAARSEELTLVTRPEAFAGLDAKTQRLAGAWALKDIVASPEVPEGETDEAPRDADLHAKLYLREGPGDTALLLGSMNATASGLRRNVELLVRLTCKAKDYGAGDLLHDLFGKDPSKGPFERLEPGAKEEASAEEDARSALQDIVGEYCRCGAKGRVEKDGEKCSVSLDVPPSFAPGDGVECRLRPLGWSRGRGKPAKGRVRFGGLSEGELSPLFVLAAKKAGVEVERVVRVPLEGLDEATRDAAAEREIVEANGGWEEYLAMLFSDEPYWTAAEARRRREEGAGRGPDARRTGLPPGLYEKMLRAAAAPGGAAEAFDAAEAELRHQSGTEADKARRLLAAFRKALGGRRKT